MSDEEADKPIDPVPAPWTMEQTQSLMEFQAHPWTAHYTCPFALSRPDLHPKMPDISEAPPHTTERAWEAQHEVSLMATRTGLICPWCWHKQDTADWDALDRDVWLKQVTLTQDETKNAYQKSGDDRLALGLLRPALLRFALTMESRLNEREAAARETGQTWTRANPWMLSNRKALFAQIDDEINDLRKSYLASADLDYIASPHENLVNAADVADLCFMVAEESGALSPYPVLLQMTAKVSQQIKEKRLLANVDAEEAEAEATKSEDEHSKKSPFAPEVEFSKGAPNNAGLYNTAITDEAEVVRIEEVVKAARRGHTNAIAFIDQEGGHYGMSPGTISAIKEEIHRKFTEATQLNALEKASEYAKCRAKQVNSASKPTHLVTGTTNGKPFMESTPHTETEIKDFKKMKGY